LNNECDNLSHAHLNAIGKPNGARHARLARKMPVTHSIAG
jgi:hypothetical protein